MVVVYIASPYTIGDKEFNVNVQIVTYHLLQTKGYAPIAPLLSHFVHKQYPMPYESWLKIDFELIRRSDAVLRLPGESSGADREVAFAKENGIPVFESVEDLQKIFE